VNKSSGNIRILTKLHLHFRANTRWVSSRQSRRVPSLGDVLKSDKVRWDLRIAEFKGRQKRLRGGRA